MSKFVTADNLLTTFPSSLAEDELKLALASVVATELVKLYEDNDILAIYARIDELDEPLLDILAHDFKVDWWDVNFSLDEKRSTFKNCWNVHRKLGVPKAINTALTDLYKNAVVLEWYNYGGNPYYFKIHIDADEVITDYEKLQHVADGIRYYQNKRSRLESIEISMKKSTNLYVGVILHESNVASFNVSGIEPTE